MVLSTPLAAPRSWVPRLPEPVVARPRLDELLTEGRRRQVTLVAAPPGAGKTTLLAGWVRRTYDVPAAWLTVEPSDDLPGRFVRSVLDALGGIGALAPHDRSGGDGDLSMLDDALHELALAGHRAVLVLDDVHELTSAGSVAALGRLVERAPQELELLIASRADPPLRIGRLRVEGRLSEIRNADLLFRLSEAAELFQAHGLHVTQRDVLAIHERAEGWAAGLRLIAYAIEKGANPRRFALDGGPAEEAVSEYLLTEVLERQDEAVQRFLQRTSIVDELTPDLAIALCDDVDAGSRLADLERRGVFLTEVDGEERYRYHALFAALLRARLRHDDPELRRALHRRAADWYGSRNMVVAAEHHARAAEDWPVLGELVMSRWLQTMLSGQDPTHGLVDGLPEEVVLDTPQLSIVASATAAVHGDRDTAERLRKGCPEPGSAWLSESRRVEGEAAVAVADLVRARAFGRSDAPDGTIAAAGIVEQSADASLIRFASLCRAEIALDEADLLRAAATLASLAEEGATWTSATARALLALVHALEGRLGAARSQAATAVGQITGPNRQRVTEIAALAVAIANAQHSHRGPAGTSSPVPEIMSSRALRVVHEAVAATLAGPGMVTLDRSIAEHPLAALALVSLGVLEVVDATGARVPVGGAPESAVRRARGALDVAAFSSIDELIAPWASTTAVIAHPRTLVEASALAAIAASAQGHHEEAAEHIGRALMRAAPDRLWEPLRMYGPAVSTPLEWVAREAGPHQAAAMVLLDEARQMQSPPFVQPLTDQERAVLRLLATLMSNTEIAGAMHLSVNTIKTHLKALYRKLGVDRRRDAVVRARQLDLL